MNDNGNTIIRLQRWYLDHCNGDWEHLFGFKLDNIDNPGWTFEVNLEESILENEQFESINIQRKDEDDWLRCLVKDRKFDAMGGPQNLEEMMSIFLDWYESVNEMKNV